MFRTRRIALPITLKFFALALMSAPLCLVDAHAQDSSPEDFDTSRAAHIISGIGVEEKLGAAVSSAGDANADGYDDILVGSPGFAGGGRALIVNGQNGQIIHEIRAPSSFNYRFGLALSGVGDMDGDGFDDALIGDYLHSESGEQAGRAWIYSGRTGAALVEYRCSDLIGAGCGFSLAGNCDIDRDGRNDIVIGAPFDSRLGKVYIYSGFDNQILFSLTGEFENDQFGRSVSCNGDFDGDGYDDILVGAPANDLGGAEAGAAYVYSGKTGELLSRFIGETNEAFGLAVSFVGDLDNDGADEVVVGGPHEASGANGVARVFRRAQEPGSGELLFSLSPLAGGRNFGSSVSYLGDVNEDSVPDILVGDPAYSTNQGRAWVFSGADGTVIRTYTGEWFSRGSDNYGMSLFAAGDANADGVLDLIIGAPINSGAAVEAGRAYLFFSPSPTAPPPPPPPPEEEKPSNPDDDLGSVIEPRPPEPVCEAPPPPPSPVIIEPELDDIQDVIALLDKYYGSPSHSDIMTLFHYWMRKWNGSGSKGDEKRKKEKREPSSDSRSSNKKR